MLRTILISLLLLSGAPAFSSDASRVIEGNRDIKTADAVLSGKEEWFNRALNLCVENGYCQDSFFIRATIEPDGTVSDCQLIGSDIKNPKIADIFCKVTKSATFSPHESRFVFEYPILVRIFAKNGKDTCPPSMGTRDSNARLVVQCLDYHLKVLNSLQQSLIRIYKAPAADVTGNITLEVVINSAGKASKIKVPESSIRDRNFVSIIRETVYRINFGPSSKKTTHKLLFSVPFDRVESMEDPRS